MERLEQTERTFTISFGTHDGGNSFVDFLPLIWGLVVVSFLMFTLGFGAAVQTAKLTDYTESGYTISYCGKSFEYKTTYIDAGGS